MKNNTAKKWFILWAVLLSLGSLFSAACQLIWPRENGPLFQATPYADYQLFLLLGFAPFVLIPLLGFAYYYAKKEQNKPIRIASLCLIIQHGICIISVLLQILG